MKDDVNFLVGLFNGNSAISTNGILEEEFVCVWWRGAKMSSNLKTLSLKCIWDIQVERSRRPGIMGVKFWSEISTADVDLGIISI